MKKIKWCGYEWLPQERWGNIHPDKPKAWYDESAIEIRGEQLVLKTHKNPKYFKELDITSNIGVGLVSCTEKFKYGKFEIEAKLPEGPYLWPAFWTWAFESWPPEIDIIEAYSDKKGSYFNFNLEAGVGKFWHCETNIHLGELPDNGYSLGAKNHCWGWRNPKKTFNHYMLDWRSDRIDIFYNKKLVRSIRDKEVLDQFNSTTQNVIINNMVHWRHDKHNPSYSEFVVNYFKYTPLEDIGRYI